MSNLICRKVAVGRNYNLTRDSLTMNIMSVVYTSIDYVVNRRGLHNFSIYKYTVTGRMAMLPMNAGREDIISSMCVAAVFKIGRAHV